MKLTTAQKAFAAIIVANLIWGGAAPIFKLSLTNIPPFTLAFLRFSVGSILLAFILGKRIKLPTKNKKDLFILIGYALASITVNILFFFFGLRLTLAINAPIIAAGQPIIVYILALFFLREKFYLKKIIGMIIGLAGIILIVIEPLLHTGIGGSFIGNMFLVIATLGAVIGTILGKKILGRIDTIAFTFWAFIIGTASFLPLAIYDYIKIPTLYSSLNAYGFMGIIYGAVFSSAIAYALYAWGLSKINASDVSMFSYIDPIVGTALGAILLNEKITSYFIWGSVLIFGGILLAEGRLHYHRFRHSLFLPNGERVTESIPPEKIEPTPHHPTKSKKEILSKIFSDTHQS